MSLQQNLCKMGTLKGSKIVFLDQLSLNAGHKYCRMLQGGILQYFWPSLSYRLSLKFLFCLFFSGFFTQVLLYFKKIESV